MIMGLDNYLGSGNFKPEQKQKWRSQSHIRANTPDSYLEFAERKFLTDTFNGLPLEKRKDLLGFSMINPFDGKQPESKEESNHRERLRFQNYIEFNAEIII